MDALWKNEVNLSNPSLILWQQQNPAIGKYISVSFIPLH